MNRAQLAHLLRASSEIAGDPHILVIRSQAILGTSDEDLLPAPATASREVDIAFLDDLGSAKADLVDGAIGELSPCDEQFGYYAQGVEVSTARPTRDSGPHLRIPLPLDRCRPEQLSNSPSP